MPLIRLHCFSQIDSIFTFLSDYSVIFPLLQNLRSVETKKLLVPIVLHKLQRLFLPVTRRVVQLELCIVPSGSISRQNPRKIWVIVLLRSTVLQNPKLPSSVDFVINSFWDFTIHVKKNIQHGFPIKTTNFDSDDIINEVVDMNLKDKLRPCQQFPVDSELERARHKVFKCAVQNRSATVRGRRAWSLLQQPKLCSHCE